MLTNFSAKKFVKIIAPSNRKSLENIAFSRLSVAPPAGRQLLCTANRRQPVMNSRHRFAAYGRLRFAAYCEKFSLRMRSIRICSANRKTFPSDRPYGAATRLARLSRAQARRKKPT